MSFSEEEIEEFKSESRELLDVAETSLLALDGGAEFRTTYDKVFRSFHNLKGAAGIMELAQLKTHTHGLENILVEFKDKNSIPKKHISFFLRGIDGARALLDGQEINFDFNISDDVTEASASSSPTKILVIENITELKEGEQALKKAQADLVSSAKLASLGKMAAGIAHEINNPLTVISGKAEILMNRIVAGKIENEKIVEGLSSISNSCLRIAKIIAGLRTFSREAGNAQFQSSNVFQILEESLSFCMDRFKLAKIELRMKCSQDIQILCRPTEISQIFVNLLGNSIDAISDLKDRWIEIESVICENSVQILFTDSGCGIAPHIVERLMEPFFTTKDFGMGSGLGLSISKGIAKGHNGSLSYKSGSPNTCFVLELPFNQTPLFVNSRNSCRNVPA